MSFKEHLHFLKIILLCCNLLSWRRLGNTKKSVAPYFFNLIGNLFPILFHRRDYSKRLNLNKVTCVSLVVYSGETTFCLKTKEPLFYGLEVLFSMHLRSWKFNTSLSLHKERLWFLTAQFKKMHYRITTL